METRTDRLLNPPPRVAKLAPAALGALAAGAALLAVAAWIMQPRIGVLMAAGWGALALGAVGWIRPMSLVWLLLGAGLYNYGVPAGGATLKPTELVLVAMLGLILARLAAGDRELVARLRRVAPLVALLALLALLAVATAAPHPKAFNARYEVLNYVALLYGLLFFRAGEWRPLLLLFAAAVALEGTAALAMRFLFGISGLDFQHETGGVVPFQLSRDELEELAGGRFRLAGTLSHKNMLAAFFVLLLPPIAVAAFRRRSGLAVAAALPALGALALTDSMTGWFALIVVLVLMLLFLRRFDYLAIMTLIILPLAAAGLYQFGEPIFYRIEQLFGTHSGWGTVSSRMQIFQISMRLIAEHPWAGIGRGNFALYGQTYYSHAHNLFLMKIIEMGLPAGLAFLGVIVAIFGRIWWATVREAGRLSAQGQYFNLLGVALGLTGFLAMNMLDYNYSHFSLGPLFMALLGIALAVAIDLPGVSEKKIETREPQSRRGPR